MPGVRGEAVLPYVRPEAPVLLVLLAALMAGPAQGLQLAEAELIPVALVSRDMISDHSSHDKALLQAMRAERMLAHLETLPDLPSTKPVPVARIARPRGHADFFRRFERGLPERSLHRGDTMRSTERGSLCSAEIALANRHNGGMRQAPQFRVGQLGLSQL